MSHLKNIRRIAVLFIFFVATMTAQASVRTAKYELRVFGMNIGTFTVNQETIGNEIKTTGITDVKVKVIFTYSYNFV